MSDVPQPDHLTEPRSEASGGSRTRSGGDSADQPSVDLSVRRLLSRPSAFVVLPERLATVTQ